MDREALTLKDVRPLLVSKGKPASTGNVLINASLLNVMREPNVKRENAFQLILAGTLNVKNGMSAFKVNALPMIHAET